jgi:hypothetical protein
MDRIVKKSSHYMVGGCGFKGLEVQGSEVQGSKVQRFRVQRFRGS